MKVQNTSLINFNAMNLGKKILSFDEYICLIPDNLSKCGVQMDYFSQKVRRTDFYSRVAKL